MRRLLKKLRAWALPIAAGILAVLCMVCLIWFGWLGRLLPSQKQAERWQGDGETKFAQISCFLPEDQKLSLQQVYAFRTEMLKALEAAAMDAKNASQLFSDAWSTSGKVDVSTDQGHGKVSVMAVGGSFFQFHPIRLLSGNYISPDDLMQDRVLLDEETAWLLFGGTELTGMSMKINGQPFVVAGVIEREQDFASKKAYSSGMGIFMSFDAYYSLLNGGSNAASAPSGKQEGDQPQTPAPAPSVGISCYETVLAEPVKGFTMNLAKEKFPIGGGMIVDNSGRFEPGTILKLLSDFGERSMQTHGVILPYWENAARCVEDWCLLALLLAIIAALMPAALVLLILIRYIRKGQRKLADDILPQAKEKAEEAIRVQQRKAWERRFAKTQAREDPPSLEEEKEPKDDKTP